MRDFLKIENYLEFLMYAHSMVRQSFIVSQENRYHLAWGVKYSNILSLKFFLIGSDIVDFDDSELKDSAL